jgi:hypothetical protein
MLEVFWLVSNVYGISMPVFASKDICGLIPAISFLLSTSASKESRLDLAPCQVLYNGLLPQPQLH